MNKFWKDWLGEDYKIVRKRKEIRNITVLIVRFLITNIKVFFYNNTLALKYSFHFCLDPFVFDIWKVSPGIKNPICHSKWQQIFRKELAYPKTAHFSPDFLSLKSCLKTSRSPYPDKTND